MIRNPLQELVDQGQSVWLDYLSRDLIRSGQLEQMIADDGLRGITSNPTIFHGAISGSDTYDAEIASLAASGLDAEATFETLAIADIRAACDILMQVYETSQGRDGFVSLEVSPHLARDTAGTVSAARRLADRVDHRNLMIKVPATREGLPAIETLLGEGINVNITLIFAQEVYRAVAETYINALEARAARGESVDNVASVASTFVSRIDSAVDAQFKRWRKVGRMRPRRPRPCSAWQPSRIPRPCTGFSKTSSAVSASSDWQLAGRAGNGRSGLAPAPRTRNTLPRSTSMS